MNKEKLEQIAQKVISNIKNQNKDDNFGFIVTVLMIISIVLTCIRIIQECHKNKRFEEVSEKGQFYSEKVHTLTRFPNWYARHKVKKIVRKELSPEDYKLYGLDLTDALFVTGADLTEEETQTLVEAANV
jgi:hypothetical protein